MAVESVRSVEGVIAGLFLRGNGRVEFAGGDLFRAGVDEAELAGSQIVLGGAHGWSKRPAENRAILIEIAGAVFKVENGAGFVVGELFEEDGGFVVLVEDAGGTVAREPGVEAGEGVGHSCVDARGFFWICFFKEGEAFAEARGVLVRDGEDSDAALGAAGFADEVGAATERCGCEGSVDDL